MALVNTSQLLMRVRYNPAWDMDDVEADIDSICQAKTTTQDALNAIGWAFSYFRYVDFTVKTHSYEKGVYDQSYSGTDFEYTDRFTLNLKLQPCNTGQVPIPAVVNDFDKVKSFCDDLEDFASEHADFFAYGSNCAFEAIYEEAESLVRHYIAGTLHEIQEVPRATYRSAQNCVTIISSKWQLPRGIYAPSLTLAVPSTTNRALAEREASELQRPNQIEAQYSQGFTLPYRPH
jgi:hypothetical protein